MTVVLVLSAKAGHRLGGTDIAPKEYSGMTVTAARLPGLPNGKTFMIYAAYKVH